jgi:hypothetical protein
MSQLVRDVRFALRSMAKSPGVSLLMIGTLAVGLAANGVIFNVLDAMVVRSFEYPNTSRLVRLYETGPGTDSIDRENVSPANLLDWQAQAKGAVAELIAIDEWETSLRTVGASEHPRPRPSPGSSRRSASPRRRARSPRGGAEGRDRRVIQRCALAAQLRRPADGGPHGDPEHGTVRGRRHRPAPVPVPDGVQAWVPLAPLAVEARRDQHS